MHMLVSIDDSYRPCYVHDVVKNDLENLLQ